MTFSPTKPGSLQEVHFEVRLSQGNLDGVFYPTKPGSLDMIHAEHSILYKKVRGQETIKDPRIVPLDDPRMQAAFAVNSRLEAERQHYKRLQKL